MAMVIQALTFLHQYWYEGTQANKVSKTPVAVKIGVLSSAMINPASLFHPAASYAGADVIAIASRDEGVAKKAAKSYNIPKSYSSYEALLADPEVEAVYISLPNALHGEWAIKSMRAGKHVLIEKPLCANAEEAREIFRVAEETGKIALEAFHWRFHPATQAVKEMIDQGTFGRVTRTYARMITPKNTIPGSDIRWKYNLGGGALMDDTYTVSSTRFFTNSESVEVVSAKARPWSQDPRIDAAMEIELKINSAQGHVIDSKIYADLDQPNLAYIIPKVWQLPAIEIELENAIIYYYNFMMPHLYHYISIYDKKTGQTKYEKHYNFPSEPASAQPWSTYRYQLEAFCNKVRGNNKPHHWVSAEDSIQQMEVIDSAYEKSGLGKRMPTAQLV